MRLFHEAYSKKRIGSPFPGASREKWFLAVSKQSLEGALSLVVTFMLIITADDGKFLRGKLSLREFYDLTDPEHFLQTYSRGFDP